MLDSLIDILIAFVQTISSFLSVVCCLGLLLLLVVVLVLYCIQGQLLYVPCIPYS